MAKLKWIGSDILDLESSRNPDADRRRWVEVLLSCVTSKVAAGERERREAGCGAAPGARLLDWPYR